MNIDIRREEIENYTTFIKSLNEDIEKKNNIIDKQKFLTKLLNRALKLHIQNTSKNTLKGYVYIDKYIHCRIKRNKELFIKKLISKNELESRRKLLDKEKFDLDMKYLKSILSKNKYEDSIYIKYLIVIQNKIDALNKNIDK